MEAIPTGQVLLWQARAIKQPSATRALVPKGEFVGAQDGCDAGITPALETAVNPQPDFGAQLIGHQRLLSLSQSQLPRYACELDERQWEGAADFSPQLR
jgi:hypothetical protein